MAEDSAYGVWIRCDAMPISWIMIYFKENCTKYNIS